MCDYEVPGFGVQHGWQRPICKRVYAPFVSECFNCGRVNVVTNVENTLPEIDWGRLLYKEYTGTGTPNITLNGAEVFE